MSELLNVDSALERILSHITRLPAETVALTEALGRVLAADMRAEIALPPFANSSMDGYAVRAADTLGAADDTPQQLHPIMDIPAGAPVPDQSLAEGQAARIMTGAPLPAGADAVIPMEQTDQGWAAGENPPLPEAITVRQAVAAGAYVRPVGEDVQVGQVVLNAGTLIRPQELGMLASLGHSAVSVVRRPRVALLSTGDELVDVNEALTPGKIRDSNSYTLFGLIMLYGGTPIRIPIVRDTLDDARRRFEEALSHQPDVVISSAGVSVGTFDVVRTVLTELGQVNFWRVNVRPGKPLAFGQLRGVPFFGLPGNPVSAMVTFDVFVRPTLLKLTGRPDALPTIEAALAEDLRSDGRRSYLRVTLDSADGRYIATTTGTQSSGALSSMLRADGLLIIPEGVTQAQAGDRFKVRLLRGFA
ncbi:MAG: molybdopterin molybdotransferase MoeA [Chloroflexi bacterium]|nr:molybdopterin molybdotransferase MoeA [Chloroflexota bacterium]